MAPQGRDSRAGETSQKNSKGRAAMPMKRVGWLYAPGVLLAFIGLLEMRSFGGHRRKTSWQDGLDRQVLRATIFFWNANLRSKDSRDAPACKS
jgi:hypothetical protein